jgi:enamine deaminase RidA (YjgF/YER057c/UK114 family)
MMTDRLNISSGVKWEDIIGYSRAVRVGNVIEVAGTTAIDEAGNLVGADNPYEQTRYIITKIEKAIIEAGASLKDIVRTRIFTTDISRWEEIGRAHGESFREIKPASTMVEVKSLINPVLLVEMEATVILQENQ